MISSLDKYQHSIPIIALIFILTLPMSAFFLRQNNLEMVSLRDEVIRIDQETGNLNKIEPAMEELREYVLNHMNTDLVNGVELPGAYNKAVERARAKAERSGTANSRVYRLAQELCEDPNLPLTARAQCIQEFVTDNAQPGTDPTELEFPPKELYVYNFVSPVWSADIAGLSVLLNIVLGVWLVYLLLSQVIIRRVSSWIENDPLE